MVWARPPSRSLHHSSLLLRIFCFTMVLARPPSDSSKHSSFLVENVGFTIVSGRSVSKSIAFHIKKAVSDGRPGFKHRGSDPLGGGAILVTVVTFCASPHDPCNCCQFLRLEYDPYNCRHFLSVDLMIIVTVVIFKASS